MKQFISELTALANTIDNSGLEAYAERIDNIIEKIAAGPTGFKLQNGKTIMTTHEAYQALQDPATRQYIITALYGTGQTAREAARGPTFQYVVDMMVQKGLVAEHAPVAPSMWDRAKDFAQQNIVEPIADAIGNGLEKRPVYTGGAGDNGGQGVV